MAANRGKSECRGSMSQEIRRAMKAIIGMSELLQDTELIESQAEYVRMVNESGESLLSLINDILDFSKIEAGIMNPTEDDLERLSEALDFPPDFFTQNRPVPGPGMSELFHRKRQRIGVKDLNRVYANATIQIMNIEAPQYAKSQYSSSDSVPIWLRQT